MFGPMFLRLSEMDHAERQANAAKQSAVFELFARRYHAVAQEVLEETGLEPRWVCPDSLGPMIDSLPANLLVEEPMVRWAWEQYGDDRHV